MIELSNAINEYFQSRGPRKARLLFWIEARNRSTSAVETIGFWTGGDHRDFSIGGQTRTYYGAGTLLRMNPLTVSTGLQVRNQRIVFSSVPPEVQLAARGFETRNGPVQLHVAYFDALTHELIDEPLRRFKGRCKGLTIPRAKRVPGAKASGEATLEISVRSSAEDLTRTLPLKKSDEALQARSPGDRLRRYADVSGTVESVWGDIRAKAPEAPQTGTKEKTPPRTSPRV